MAQPHDHLFQLVFADPAHAQPLLRSALPASLAKHIDWSTLTRRNAAQRGRRGRRTICDVLFSVQTHGRRELLLYVVLEHKSEAGRFDALQMLEQVLAVLRTHRREHPDRRFLPPVLPIVVHADHRPWRSPRQFRELFDLQGLPEQITRYLPSFTYVLDDLHDLPPAALRQRALTVFGLCTLSMLQFLPQAARDRDALAAWVDEWWDVTEQAARLAAAGSDRELFDAVVHYVNETSDLPSRVIHQTLHRRLSAAAMKNFVSTADQLRTEGRAEGRTEGRTEGMAEVLLRLLTRRFGPLDEHTVEHVRQATASELGIWTDSVLDAASLDQVFADGDAS